MEPYRPFVDKLVCEIVAKGNDIKELTQETKFKLLNIPVIDVIMDGQRSPLMNAVGKTTSSLYKCFAGKVRKIKYPTFM
jgi:CRISPR-associated protein Cas1